MDRPVPHRRSILSWIVASPKQFSDKYMGTVLFFAVYSPHDAVAFMPHVAAPCVRGHRIGKDSSNIGPELTKIAAQRDANYILRAIVSPSADIDPKYKATSFVLDSGIILSGMIRSESNHEVAIAADARGVLSSPGPRFGWLFAIAEVSLDAKLPI